MSNKFFVKYKWDYTFFIFTVCMVVIGSIMVYSASYFEIGYKTNYQKSLFQRQVFFAGLGLFAMWVISKINYQEFKKLVIPINIITIISYILLIDKFGLSVNFRGATRWIQVGGIQFMPSDLAKYATILSVAYILGQNRRDVFKKKSDLFIAVCPIIYIIGTMLQPDLSTTVVIIGSIVATLYLGALHTFLIIIIGGIGAFFSGAYILSSPTRWQRVLVFLDPFKDPSDKGYQVIQSLVAVASGGVGGLGLGKGRQKMLYLPLSYNDYIFSIYAEELGFVGCVLFVVTLTSLILRGLKITVNAPDKFATLLAGGIISQIAIQSIINLYVAVNLIPSTGINLPIISYGGTSLVTTLGALGVVLGISRFENKKLPSAFRNVKDKKYHSLEESREKK